MRWLLIAAVMAVGCGGPVRVVLDTDPGEPHAAPWLKDPGLADRVIAAADAAVRVWGGSISDLDGWTIHLANGFVDCGGGVRCAGFYRESAIGGDIWISTQGFHCVEVTYLWHEVGHVVIGDDAHGDSRWKSVQFHKKIAQAERPLVPNSGSIADSECARMLDLGGGW